MNYETTQQAADRLGISIHIIRQWAKEDRIPGAVRHGRSWRIPVDFQPSALRGASAHAGEQAANGGRPARIAMPLMNSAYPLGSCRDFIETIPGDCPEILVRDGLKIGRASCRERV